MSMHFDKDNYRCLNCNAIFLPYKINFKCPNCGQLIPDSDTKEYINSIEDIANSLEVHKRQYGHYFPGAWNVFNIMDHIQSIVFSIFDALERDMPENKEQFINDSLENNFIWVKQIYLKDHIKEIAMGVLELYEKGKFDEITRGKMEEERPISTPEILREMGYRGGWLSNFFEKINSKIKKYIRNRRNGGDKTNSDEGLILIASDDVSETYKWGKINTEESEDDFQKMIEKNRIESEKKNKWKRRWGYKLFDENHKTIKVFELKCSGKPYNACFNSSEVFMAFHFEYTEDANLPKVGEKEMFEIYIEGFEQHECAKAIESGDVLIFSKTEGKIIDKVMRKDSGRYSSDRPGVPESYEFYLPDGTMFFKESNFMLFEVMEREEDLD